MDKIEVKVLNPDVVIESEKMMVAMARLTQRGHKIHNMEDFEKLLNLDYNDTLVNTLVDLPHPTIQKFGVINIMVIGASRRFLAQITRHQNEVKFMSGSLQYSDYSDEAQFVVPYSILEADAAGKYVDMHFGGYGDTKACKPSEAYLQQCQEAMDTYSKLSLASDNDAAGYAAPQGLRNVLLISATPYQLKHMIRQRTCNRNTMETQYVMLLIWEQLYKLSNMFEDCGPFCLQNQLTGMCPEGKMSCGEPYAAGTRPEEILRTRFGLIRRED